MDEEKEKDPPDNREKEDGYVTYGSRWAVLATVALLNLAINTLLLSFSSVSTAAAVYFGRDPEQMSLLTGVGFLVSTPICLVSTWFSDKFGLRSVVI